MIFPDTLMQSKVQVSAFLSSMLDRKGVKPQPHRVSRPDTPMVMDLVPADSDGMLDVLIGCLGAMSVLQARTVELSAEIEDHLAESARERRELRADMDALTQRSLVPQLPPEEPQQRLARADAARVEALHQRLQAVETGIGQIVCQMIASYVGAEPDVDNEAEHAGRERTAGMQARLTAATAAAAHHRARVAGLCGAPAAAASDEVTATDRRAAGLNAAA